MEEYDPYLHGGMTLIDTDYKNFMISYHCRETVNEEGDAHFLAISIFAREPLSITDSRLEELKDSLQKIVPAHDFKATHYK